MRVFILVENDRFFIPKMLSQFIPQYGGDLVGVGIARRKYSSPITHIVRSLKNFERKLIIFGPLGLLRLLFKLKKPTSAKSAAQKFGIPFYELFNINSPESLSLLKQHNIDVIISLQDQIFKKDLIRLPKIGCINKHAALLPKYPGVWPIFWAMLDGEKEIGLTVHWIDEGIDTGKIIVQKRVSVGDDDSLFDLYERVFELCSQSLVEALEKIEENPKFGLPQPPSDGKYYSFPKRCDVLRFKQLGKKIL